jgi:hypothetical protein
MTVTHPEAIVPAVNTTKSWWPTNKWLAAVVTAVTAWFALWIRAGEFTDEVKIALIAVVSQALLTYFVSNQDTPGGVPTKKT